MPCGTRITLGPRKETYCMRPPLHKGKHSIYADYVDDPKPPAEKVLVMPSDHVVGSGHCPCTVCKEKREKANASS